MAMMASTDIEHYQLPDEEPLQIIRVDETNRQSFQRRPHRHNYFEVVWTEVGEGEHCIDFTAFPLRPRTLYLIAPGQVHQIVTPPELMFVLTFQADFIESGYRNRLLLQEAFATFSVDRACIELDQLGYRHLDHLGEIMDDEIHRAAPDWDLLESLLTAFLHYLTRYLPDFTPESVYIDPRIMNLFDLLEAHYRQQRHTSFYAEQIGLTPKRLNELTRQNLGKTVTQLRHERVIVEARRELTFTPKTIKTIAYELGFEDVAYFCRFFRRETGISPLGFRKLVFA